MKSGGTPKSDNKLYYAGNIPFLSISDLQSKFLTITSKFISDDAIKNSSSYILKKNNLLLSIYATIGKPAINKIDVSLPQSILGIILKEENCLEFFYQYMHYLQKHFIKISETGSQPNLSLFSVSRININIPSLAEQQRIAIFLSSYDKLIDYCLQIILITKKIKEKYLNELFI